MVTSKDTQVIGVRMPKEDVQLLQKVSKARGEDVSDFVRHAIYLKLAHLDLLDEERTTLLLGKKREEAKDSES